MLLLLVVAISFSSLTTACPIHCQCAQNKTVFYCYMGGLNDSHFYHILETLPLDTLELDIQAPTNKPNKFHWNDNLNRLINLKRLFLRNCGIPALSQRIRLKRLIQLDLQHNGIESLQMDLFTGMPNLQILDLAYNKVSVLPTGCFLYLKALTSLSLSHNHLSNLPSNLLHGPRSLTQLELDGNRLPIDQINVLLSSVPNLERIELNFCWLEDQGVAQLQLHRVPSVRRLGVSGNNLTFVPSSTIRALAHLQVIDLSYNKIRTLQPCAFCACNVSTVLLSHNLLGIDDNSLHLESFAHVNITEIDLSFNFFDNFDSKVLGRAQNSIQVLHLSGNTLTYVQKRHIQTLHQLQELHIASNHIEYPPKTWPNEFAALTKLNLSDNHISQLPQELELSFPLLKELDLSKNLLSELDIHSTDFFLQNLDLVLLDGNPWDCRCASQGIQRYLNQRKWRNLRYEQVICAEPSQLKHFPVHRVQRINECALLFDSKYQLTQLTELGILIVIVTSLACFAAMGLIAVLYCSRRRSRRAKPFHRHSSSQVKLTQSLDTTALTLQHDKQKHPFRLSVEEHLTLTDDLPPALPPISRFTSY